MPKVKICGITNLEDALVAAQAGADFLGFIFYEPSPRYIAPETVKEIVLGVREQGLGIRKRTPGNSDHALLKFVGVFVNASFEEIDQILDYCQLDAAQLHGEESPRFVSQFGGRAFKALRPQTQEEADTLVKAYLPCSLSSQLPCFLLDAYHPTLYGGTGHVTDWTIAATIAQRYPIMLAGSLAPTNVVEAIRAVKPWGVDVSSGVEAEKGKKDHDKVRALVKRAKGIK